MIPTETLHTLEFDKILQTVSGFTNSAPSCEAALALGPLGDKSAIELRLGQVEEIRRLAGMNISLRLFPF
jgi:dsDNA-specific endonuclease/ATPase MutS2